MYGLFVEAIYNCYFNSVTVYNGSLDGWKDETELKIEKDKMLLKTYPNDDNAESFCLAEADREIYQTASPNFNYSVKEIK